MKRFNIHRVVVAVSYLFCFTALAGAAGEWGGTYIGENLTVTLRPEGADGNEYVGTITLGDRVMPARGRFDPVKGFAGVFESGGTRFGFSLAAQPDGTVVLASDDKRHALKRQAGPAGGGEPDPRPGAGRALPEFLRPGLRISYSGGSSIVAGVGSKLIPAKDGKGRWVDPVTGKSYNEEDTKNSGGVGITQIDILYADEKVIVADVRNYLMVDLQKKLVSLSGATGITGTAGSLGDYWLNPATLARLEEGRTGQGRVTRLRYTADGREYDAVGIENDLANGYSHKIYDRVTGLLLSDSNATAGDSVSTINPVTGQTGKGKGSTVISHARFIGTRQVDLPWAKEPPPQWAAARGQRLELSGGYTAVLPSGPLPGFPMSLTFEVDQPVGPAVVVKMTTRQGIGDNLPVQESTVARCFSAAGRGCLWLSPRVAQQLKPNTVIDEDAVVQYRTTYMGTQNGMAIVVEQGPLDVSQYGYDLRSGMLVWLQNSRETLSGRIETRLQAK